MYLGIYNVFYSQNSHHVSADIPAFFRVMFLLPEYSYDDTPTQDIKVHLVGYLYPLRNQLFNAQWTLCREPHTAVPHSEHSPQITHCTQPPQNRISQCPFPTCIYLNVFLLDVQFSENHCVLCSLRISCPKSSLLTSHYKNRLLALSDAFISFL